MRMLRDSKREESQSGRVHGGPKGRRLVAKEGATNSIQLDAQGEGSRAVDVHGSVNHLKL
jgi:hypothetical protein